MRRSPILLFAFFIAILLAVAAQQCLADNLPGGSYQQSCRNMSANGGTLSAQCRTRSGNWPNTSLPNYHQCIGDIQNQDGQLRCNRGAAPPGGSYTRSCRDVWLENGTLHASCQNRGGVWITSVLPNISQCRGDIQNQEGQLRCDRGATPPGGSYTASCRDIWLDNQTLHANCQNRNGGWVSSTIPDISRCRGDIQNQDGQLHCNLGGATPRGSYMGSCRDIWVDGTVLHASCPNGSGGWFPGAIDMFGWCLGDIFNFNGALTCNKLPLPGGSYQQTCSDMWVSGDTVNAHCKTAGGGMATAQLTQFSHCLPGSIENHGGTLVCTFGNQPPPQGSYRQSCSNIAMTDFTLTASCVTGSTRVLAQTSSLDVRGCTGDIANIHGFLTCPKGNGPEPAGSYLKSCRNIVVAGTVLKALCETPQGNWLPTTLANYQTCAGRIENYNGVLRCPAGPPPPGPPSPVGYAKLEVNNCNSDVDRVGKHRSISVYLLDLNLPAAGYWLSARMKTQYAEDGSCPFDENGQPADPDTINLIGHNGWVNGHSFKVVIVDPLMQACEGQDNPLIDNCVRNSFFIKANTDGDTFKYVVW
ncbi:MAG: CVNH domain-containing protein [Acidobacteriia bacterium]|nr:CVNH domain-containing protein [Terriglobia bacterium]